MSRIASERSLDDHRFAAIGINHDHIYGQVDCLLRAGAELVALPRRRGRSRRSPSPSAIRRPSASPTSADILEDQSIDADRQRRRSPPTRAASRSRRCATARTCMTDKPGMIIARPARRGAPGAGGDRSGSTRSSIPSISRPRSTVQGRRAGRGRRHRQGHQHRRPRAAPAATSRPRPAWFFERERYGGILTDIASHQCEQFLFFADARDAEVVARRSPTAPIRETPGLQDFGDMICARRRRHRLYPRRLVHAGRPADLGRRPPLHPRHRGYIELRKYIDIAGRPGTDHLFLVDSKGMRHIDCARCRTALRPPAHRRHPRPHRDRDAAGALLQGDGAGAEGAGAGGGRRTVWAQIAART